MFRCGTFRPKLSQRADTRKCWLCALFCVTTFDATLCHLWHLNGFIQIPTPSLKITNDTYKTLSTSRKQLI